MDPKDRKHFIDFLFPLTLFLVFASLSITLILMATNVYRETVQNSYYNNNARLSLAYITEKIHQNNNEDQIRITKINTTKVLEIRHPGPTTSYYTYIYFKDGYLKELFIKEELTADLEFGRNIANLSSFTMEEFSSNLYSFTCTDLNQHETTILVGIKASGGTS